MPIRPSQAQKSGISVKETPKLENQYGNKTTAGRPIIAISPHIAAGRGIFPTFSQKMEFSLLQQEYNYWHTPQQAIAVQTEDTTLASLRNLSAMRHFRLTLAALWLAPALVWAQPASSPPSPLDARIIELREMSRFVPDKALDQLKQIEAEARRAPLQTKAEFLAQLSIAYMRIGNNDVALRLAEELIAEGRRVKNDVALAKGLLTKGYVMSAMTERAASHDLAYQAERLAATTDDTILRVTVTITSGESRAEEGNFPAALIKLQTAVDLARQSGSPLLLATALNSLARLYDSMKEYDKAFEALDESLAVAKTLQSPGRLAVAKNTEYILAIDANQPRRARAALLEGLAIEQKFGAQRMIGKTLVNLSDSYLQDHDYAKTLVFANQAIVAARVSNDVGIEAVARVNIGQALIGMGRLAEGKKSFDAGLAYYEKANNRPEMQSLMLDYGHALERAGDLAGAIAAYHRERTISNELFEQQRQKSVYELQEKYETEKKQRQIELLRRENLVKSTEIDNRRLQQRVWWLLLVVFALAAVIVGLLYRKVRQTNAQLEEKNLELKQQSSRDPLTALYNRRHFQEFMKHYIQVEKRGAGTSGEDIVGALFLLDVDHFKHVNDTYGHAAGDAVLKMIAENLAVLLRETDMIVRWGGEEFLAFLPAIPRSGVDEIARRILNGISTQTIAYQDRQLSVNVSVGFAPFPLVADDGPLSWERAVNLVDMALYLAKAHGRNRAYGVRGFDNFADTSLEAIEQDLERAWRAGFVDLSVVLGGTPEAPPPEPVGKPLSRHSNVVKLKAKSAGERR
jgi:diguanylate cyclase (GGDEF)-like protein